MVNKQQKLSYSASALIGEKASGKTTFLTVFGNPYPNRYVFIRERTKDPADLKLYDGCTLKYWSEIKEPIKEVKSIENAFIGFDDYANQLSVIETNTYQRRYFLGELLRDVRHKYHALMFSFHSFDDIPRKDFLPLLDNLYITSPVSFSSRVKKYFNPTKDYSEHINELSKGLREDIHLALRIRKDGCYEELYVDDEKKELSIVGKGKLAPSKTLKRGRPSYINHKVFRDQIEALEQHGIRKKKEQWELIGQGILSYQSFCQLKPKKTKKGKSIPAPAPTLHRIIKDYPPRKPPTTDKLKEGYKLEDITREALEIVAEVINDKNPNITQILWRSPGPSRKGDNPDLTHTILRPNEKNILFEIECKNWEVKDWQAYSTIAARLKRGIIPRFSKKGINVVVYAGIKRLDVSSNLRINKPIGIHVIQVSDRKIKPGEPSKKHVTTLSGQFEEFLKAIFQVLKLNIDI